MRVTLGGTGPVGPSLSTFYFVGSMTGVPASVLNLYTALLGQLPTGMAITVPNNGDVLNDTNGVLTGGWTSSGGGNLTAAGGTVYPAGVGYRITWPTNDIYRNRKVTGSTFIVPIADGLFDNSGTINNSTIAATQTALNTYLSGITPKMVVWSRPHKGASDGASHVVTAAVAVDRVSTLRSRRT